LPKSYRYLAPAKVNLYLKVIRKRVDGYHDIETLFERISLCDILTFRLKENGISLRCQGEKLPSDSNNLIYRAAFLLKSTYAVKQGIDICLQKKIPVAAGLGGGSSDAATTLLALNRIWKLNLSLEKLLKHATELGSDVPFFVMQTPFAIGKGRGGEINKGSCAPKIMACVDDA